MALSTAKVMARLRSDPAFESTIQENDLSYELIECAVAILVTIDTAVLQVVKTFLLTLVAPIDVAIAGLTAQLGIINVYKTYVTTAIGIFDKIVKGLFGPLFELLDAAKGAADVPCLFFGDFLGDISTVLLDNNPVYTTYKEFKKQLLSTLNAVDALTNEIKKLEVLKGTVQIVIDIIVNMIDEAIEDI